MTRKPTRKDLEQKIIMLEEAAREAERFKVTFQEHEEKYRILIEKATDIIYQADASGRLTFINPAAMKLTGYAEKDLIGKFYAELICPDYRVEAERFYGLQFVKKFPLTYGEFPLLTLDKRKVWVGQHVQLIIKNGDVSGFHAIARDITNRKQTEEALRKSEEIYSKLVDTMPDFVIRTDLEGNILFVNDHSLQISGYSRDDVEGKNMLMFIAPEDHVEVIQNSILMMENRLGPKEYHLIMKDGRKIPFEVNGDVLRNADGTPFGIVTVCRDITERKRAEDLLIQSKQTAERYLNIAAEIIISFDADGNVMLLNESGHRLLGYQPGELQGKNWFDTCLPEEVRGEVWQYFHKLRTGEVATAESHENTVMTRNGATKTILWHNTVLKDSEDQFIGILSSGEDITKRKQIEEMLRTSEEKFRSISDAAKDAILMMNSQGLISHWNPAAEHILGYAPEEALGRNLHDLLAPERYIEDHRVAFSMFQLNGRGNVMGKTIELFAKRRDGQEIPIELSLSAAKLNGAWNAVGIIRDITERKRAEEEREKLISELKQALSEVKTLSGLLPICASCKKIRDDKGYWNLLEAYLGKHSDAKFSHGICPDCVKKLYPDLEKKIK